jgi:GNAT superfamily N-acetyltransferase
MPDITYRLATLADLDTLADLRWQMQAEYHPEALAPGVRQRYIATYRAEMLPEMEHGRLRAWIAEDAGRPVAAVTLICWLVPPAVDQPHRPRGQVSNVFTQPEYRRRSISRHLMQLLIADARELGITRLVLWASEMGEPLYLGLGFEHSHALELAL